MLLLCDLEISRAFRVAVTWSNDIEKEAEEKEAEVQLDSW